MHVINLIKCITLCYIVLHYTILYYMFPRGPLAELLRTAAFAARPADRPQSFSGPLAAARLSCGYPLS